MNAFLFLSGAPIIFGYPALFFVGAHYRRAGNSVRGAIRSLKCGDVVACAIFLFILFPICTGAGLASAFSSLLRDWNDHGPPFTCYLS